MGTTKISYQFMKEVKYSFQLMPLVAGVLVRYEKRGIC